jgi:HEAT repeat protein
MKAVMPNLDHPRREVRVAALSVLGAYGDAAIDALRRFVLENGREKVKTPVDMEMRQMAVYALGNTRSDRALPILREVLKDPQLASAAWQAIANLQTDAAKRFLLSQARRFAQERQSPPYHLVIALGAAQIQEAKPLLMQWLRSSDPRVQESAILAIGMLRVREAVPTLIPLLNSSDVGVAAAAANALGILGDPQTVPALCQVLTNAKETPRLQVVLNALSALQAIGSREALPSVQALLKMPDLSPLVREQAKQVAEHLQRFGR